MIRLMNMTDCRWDEERFPNGQSVAEFLQKQDLDGLELMHLPGGEPSFFQRENVRGLHLRNWYDWVDLWKGNMENLWWPGLTMTRPEITERLLAQVHYPRKGIMLDTGHLMHTNLDLSTEEEAIDYVLEQIGKHGKMVSYIRGMHLNQSLTGSYVKEFLSRKDEMPASCKKRMRFAMSMCSGSILICHLPALGLWNLWRPCSRNILPMSLYPKAGRSWRKRSAGRTGP